MRVLYITNIPSPYRVDYFNELGRHCDLTVAFESVGHKDRDKSWLSFKNTNFKSIFLKEFKLVKGASLSFGYKKLFKNGNFDKIILCNFTSLTGIFCVRFLKHKRIGYYLEADGAFAKNGKGLKERIKRHIISGAKGYFSTSKECDNYFLKYGADSNLIYRYKFTSLFKNDICNEVLSFERKATLRKELNIKEDKVVLAVGQFIHRKGFDVLIKSMKNLDDDVGVYIVGAEATEEYIRLKEDLSLKNLHFVGFKLKNDLKKYYFASDVFVLPTREDVWGLVINEAMACGLPIISTKKCIAGLELIKDNCNGYIVDVDDIDSLSVAIKNVLNDEELRTKMAKNSLDVIQDYTFEQMVQDHLNVIKQ